MGLANSNPRVVMRLTIYDGKIFPSKPCWVSFKPPCVYRECSEREEEVDGRHGGRFGVHICAQPT